MKEIKLTIKDNHDLLILWIALNNLQAYGRADLARNATKSKKIETQWFDEAVEEFDRIMSIKSQIRKLLEK